MPNSITEQLITQLRTTNRALRSMIADPLVPKDRKQYLTDLVNQNQRALDEARKVEVAA